MEIGRIIEWSVVIIVLIGLIYTMIIVKNEKNDYHKHSSKKGFGPFTLKIPHWWAIKKEKENYISFYRADTRYDWLGIFEILEQEKNLSSEEHLTLLLDQKKIILDEHERVEQDQEGFKYHPLYTNCTLHRIEGMGTENEMTRVYIDGFLIKDEKNGISLFGYSRSSILNGAVEGPFFEEVLNNLDHS